MATFATITLDDRSGYARSNEPVVVSIPLAEADNLTSFSSLAIRQSGSIIPAQFQVISRWGAVGDTAAPIRILQAIFRVASLAANGHDSSTYTLTDGGTGTATGGITVNAQTNYYEITTSDVPVAGSGRFRIRRTPGGGHNVLESGEVHTGSAFKTVIAAGNASTLYLHGVTNAADFDGTTNSQNADYNSSAYTTAGTNPLYSVAVESSGPERVVVLVTGKFGSTPFRGLNDEANRNSNAQVNTAACDMSYEMRYTFWRDSAYVGLAWLIKAPEGYEDIHDAAIDHGGLQITPNFTLSDVDLFVSVHNDSGTQQGEVISWGGLPRLFQQVIPNGTGYTWSLSKSGFTVTGATQLRESLLVLQKNAANAPTNDRHIVLMHRGSLNNRPVVAPHGFWHDGSNGYMSLWPLEDGEVATSYSRTYHIFPSQMFYNWQGGILLGDGLYNASTVRSQWKRFCNSPIVPWCGAKYQTSHALWYLPPSTLTRTGESDWNEAVQRRMKWGTCLVTSADSSDGRTIQSTYDDRNNNQYSFYYWHTYGAWAQGGACRSNRYDFVMRLIHAWLITGLPELWEWLDRCGQHMAFVCTNHGGQTYPAEHGGVMNTWTQYPEGGVMVEGGLHAAATNLGIGMEVNHNMYKPLLYMLTGYQPYKDTVQVLINTKRGFMYNSLTNSAGGGYDLANTSHFHASGTTRRFSWGIEEFLTAFLMQGDTTSLQYARNLALNVLVYSDRTYVGLELPPTQTTTVSTQGGMGSIPEHFNAEASTNSVLWTESTYTAYVQESMIMAHDIGAWSLAHGYSQFSSTDVARLATFIKQSARYLLIGLDDVSRSNGSTPTLRGSIVPPVLKGHHKTGGNNTLYAGPYEWPWSTVDAGANTRSTDTGYAPAYTGTCTITGSAITALNPQPRVRLTGGFLYVSSPDERAQAIRITDHYYEGTATISGTAVTALNPVPALSLAGGLFYAGQNGQGAAVTVATHTGGTNFATLGTSYVGASGPGVGVVAIPITATLLSSYGGTTGAGLSITIAAGVGSYDIWAQSVGLFAYAAKLFKDAGQVGIHETLLAATRDAFENLYLYAQPAGGGNWDQPFTATTRGSIHVGTPAFNDERIHGWHSRRSSHYYLAYEQQLAELAVPIAVAHYVAFEGRAMALIYNGSSDYLTIATGTNLKITGDISIAVWLKTTNAGSVGYHILGAYESSGSFVGYALGMAFEANPGIINYYNSGNTAWRSSTADVNDGAWHSVIMVISGTGAGAIRFYLDGILTNTASQTSPPGASTQVNPAIAIAARVDGNDKWNGSLAHLSVWNTVLTGPGPGTQIDAYHACALSTTIASANLQGYWKMPGSESPVVDSSANAYHATVVGAPTSEADPPGYVTAPSGPASIYQLFEA